MLFRALVFSSLVFSFGAFAGEVIHSDYQCRALGNHFRVMFEDRSEYLVESRIAFGLKIDTDLADKAGEAKLSYIGHVGFKKFVSGKKAIHILDGYSQFLKKDHESDLSPQASKYTDDKFFRFRDFAESASTSHDGGGMNGYLVISKKALTVGSEKEKFTAHYVFQHGDHTGGTIDYVCQKE